MSSGLQPLLKRQPISVKVMKCHKHMEIIITLQLFDHNNSAASTLSTPTTRDGEGVTGLLITHCLMGFFFSGYLFIRSELSGKERVMTLDYYHPMNLLLIECGGNEVIWLYRVEI